MGSTLQKIGLSLVVALLLAYAGYYSYKSGKLNNNLLNFRQVAAPTPSRASPSPTATPSATGKPKASVKPAATPAGAVLVSLLDATNSNRTAAGLPALVVSDTLTRLAQEHADDMVARDYFDHTTPDGVTFQQRLSAGGYSGNAAAENIGLTSGQAVSVVADWMKSPPHKANILGNQYRYVGFGVAAGHYKGVNMTYVVAIFGDSK